MGEAPSKKPSRRRQSSRRQRWAAVTSSWAAVFVVALGLLTWTLYLYSATHRLLSPPSSFSSTRSSTPRKLQQDMAVGRREGRKGEDKEEEEEPTQADDDGGRGRREEGAGDVRVDGIAGKAGSPQQQEQGGQIREGEQGEGQGSGAGLTHGLELGDREMHRGGVEQGGKEREGGRREGGREEGVGEREGVPLSLEAQVKALQKQQAEVQSWEEEVIRRIGAVETREREAKRREKVIDGKETEIAWREKEWRKEAELRRVGSEGEDEGVGLGRRVGAAGGGVSGGMRHDVMEALQMLKLTVKALEDNIEMVLNTEAG
ncbi:hypothetical protein CLOM_g2029, partial [Closterium sp. NIES-68]